MNNLTEVGWFDSATQSKPAYDPGYETYCPVCFMQLSRPAVAISVMAEGSDKSYFFRAHKACWDGASEAKRSSIEFGIIDARTPKS